MSKSRIALLALASVCSSFAVVGCSSQGSSNDSVASENVDFERVEFNLVADGAEVEEVAYTVTDSTGAEVQAGTLEVPGTDDSFVAFLLLPVGTGYTLELTATGDVNGEEIPCTGEAAFDVAAGVNSPIDVSVVCTAVVALFASLDNAVAAYGLEIPEHAVVNPPYTFSGKTSVTATGARPLGSAPVRRV